MRRALLAVVALAVALAAPVQASGDDPTTTAKAPRVDAAAYYLVGADGAVLARHRARQQRAIASITKLMTAVVAVEQAELSEPVVVTPRAAAVGGSTVFLRAGERLTVAQLLRAMLVRSANDAAEMLAIHVGRGSQSRFVAAMNAKAAALGLSDTHYANPHGLDAPGHVSSARDTTTLVQVRPRGPVRPRRARAQLGLAARRTRVPVHRRPPREAGRRSSVGRRATPRTPAGRWRRQPRRVAPRSTGPCWGPTTVPSATVPPRALLVFGLGRYRRVAVIDEGRVYGDAETGYGRPRVELVAPRSVMLTLHEGRSLVERVVRPESVGLPVAAGARLGRVEVYDGDRLIASSNLVAASTVSEPGLLGKVAWYAKTTASNLWGLVT